MAIQSAFYFTDGTTRTFPSTKHIASSSNVAVWMKRIVDDVWELTSYELWTLANNSIVFTVAPQSTVYSQIELRIADEADELTESPSNIALVAGSIANVDTVATNISAVNAVSTNIAAVQNVSANATNINTVATNIANVNTVAANASSVNTVALNIADVNVTVANIVDINTVASDLNEPVSEINTVATDIANVNAVGLAINNINTVATNISNVNTVAGVSANVTTVATNNANVTTVATNIVGLNSVVANLAEVLLADNNAAIAATKANEASDSATSAQLDAWIAEAESMTAEAYATTPLNTFVSEYTSNGDGTFTATPTSKYSALHWAATVDDANFVHITGDETIAGIKTFSSTIAGSINGNSATVTNGVYTVGNQTIAGVKTFSSSPIVPTPTTNFQAANMAYVDSKVSSSGFGVGQTWQNMTSSRSKSVAYTNSTGKPISVSVNVDTTTNVLANLVLKINGMDVYSNNTQGVSATKFGVSGIVTSGSTYEINSSGTIASWYELR